MSVTDDRGESVIASPSFKWIPGMCDYFGARICRVNEGSPVAEGHFHGGPPETQDIDLNDPATQGAIVFGIFEPLGIHINRVGGVLGKFRWAIVVCYGGEGERRLRGAELCGGWIDLADAIRAVFAALKSRAAHPKDNS